MLNSNNLCIENIINQKSYSERKFKEGNFKGAIEDKMKVRCLLNCKFCDEHILKKFKEELYYIYASKFDLINDNKLRIDESKKLRLLSYQNKKVMKNIIQEI